MCASSTFSGFASIVEATASASGHAEHEKLDAIGNALTRIQSVEANPDDYFTSREVTHFSDSLVISFAIQEESCVFFTLLDLLHLQIDLAVGGMLCRGGVTVGLVHHTSTHLFGPALVSAYHLESKAAVYPRILVDDSVIQYGVHARARHNKARDEAQHIKDLLRRDDDNRWHIDYLGGAQSELDEPEYGFPVYLSRIADILKAGYTSAPEDALPKLDWVRSQYESLVQKGRSWASGEGERELLASYMGLPLDIGS